MNPFRQAAAYATHRGATCTARRISIEGRIVRKLIKHGLDAGHSVSLFDGEEWVLRRSSKLHEIMDATFSTDGDTIRFTGPNGEKVGQVYLIYGNAGHDVISDYSSDDIDAFDIWLKPVTDYAEAQE